MILMRISRLRQPFALQKHLSRISIRMYVMDEYTHAGGRALAPASAISAEAEDMAAPGEAAPAAWPQTMQAPKQGDWIVLAACAWTDKGSLTA